MKFSFTSAVMAILATFGIRENDAIDGIVKTFYAPDGRRRLIIYHRANGVFGFQQEVYDDHPLETRWKPSKEKPSDTFPSPEEALAAAREEAPWLPVFAEHTPSN